MFIRETSADGKMSFWTIRPEANRRLTLDQVYKVSPTVCHTLTLFNYFIPVKTVTQCHVHYTNLSLPFTLLSFISVS